MNESQVTANENDNDKQQQPRYGIHGEVDDTATDHGVLWVDDSQPLQQVDQQHLRLQCFKISPLNSD
jgi:hypothetical protein